ncbi:MAG: hypothetical protein GY856_49720 [bacterium]|nr:hypothetical protein [bacterium]
MLEAQGERDGVEAFEAVRVAVEKAVSAIWPEAGVPERRPAKGCSAQPAGITFGLVVGTV